MSRSHTRSRAPRNLRLSGWVLLASLITTRPLAAQAANPSPTPAPKAVTGQTASASAEDESQALAQAFQSASGSPQQLIKNLEDFLARFPDSPRREQVLRAIFRQALQANSGNELPITPKSCSSRALQTSKSSLHSLTSLSARATRRAASAPSDTPRGSSSGRRNPRKRRVRPGRLRIRENRRSRWHSPQAT